jgi:Lon protease-like protein
MPPSTTALPLFPLTLVLFPGMELPLHIFEERYKRMINLCLREDRPFGVVLAGTATDIPGQNRTYPVGTAAHIRGATRFPDGCMNLVTRGKQRFRIHAMDWDLEYAMGEVEWLPETLGEVGTLRSQAERRWNAFHKHIAHLTNEPYDPTVLPAEPGQAAYRLAHTLPLSNIEKQHLLEATDTASRLREVVRLIEREHGILNYLTVPHPQAYEPPDESSVYRN